MANKKFVVLGGKVSSGEYMSAYKLMTLYGLKQSQCVLYDTGDNPSQYPDKAIVLSTRENGDYKDYLALCLKVRA